MLFDVTAQKGLALLNVVPSAKSLQRHGRRLQQPEPASPTQLQTAITLLFPTQNAVIKTLVGLLNVSLTFSKSSITFLLLHQLRVSDVSPSTSRAFVHGIARRWPRLVPTSSSPLSTRRQSMTAVLRFYGNRISIPYTGSSSSCYVLETRPAGQQPQCCQFALEGSFQHAQAEAPIRQSST